MKRLILVIAAILYILWPLDLIPDVVPIAGWADDLVVLLLALNQARGLFRGKTAEGATSRAGRGTVVDINPAR
jgi:uncharacterized membrane protein YkvA (DUF1232 family)